MMQAPTLATNYTRLLTDYLAARGYNLGPVTRALGMPRETTADVDRRVPRRAFNRALEIAIGQTGDAFLGLRIGRRVRPAHYGVLGYLLMSCESPRQVMALHQRWHALLAGGERAEYVGEPGRIRLLHHLPPDPALVTRPGVECSLASTLTFARWLLGADADPIEMQFPYPAPGDLIEYERLFRCRLVFDADCAGMCISDSVLGASLPQGDPELYALMEAKARRRAAELGLAEDALIGRVRRTIADALPEGGASQARVAAALNMSPHTLKRRLAEHGTGFKRELDTVRRDLAIGYLRDPQLSLLEIAQLLNFSEQSAFQRAFKRWTGRTPRQMRADPADAGGRDE